MTFERSSFKAETSPERDDGDFGEELINCSLESVKGTFVKVSMGAFISLLSRYI